MVQARGGVLLQGWRRRLEVPRRRRWGDSGRPPPWLALHPVLTAGNQETLAGNLTCFVEEVKPDSVLPRLGCRAPCPRDWTPKQIVTNVCEFWRCDVPLNKLDGQVSQDRLNSACDDSVVKLREVFEYQTPSLTIQDSKATLKFQDGRETLTFDLFKVSLSESRKLAQDLVFGLVEQVQKLEKQVDALASAGPSPLSSPEKNTLKSQSVYTSVKRHPLG